MNYKVGDRVIMKVPEAPIDKGPGYVVRMIERFSKNPEAKIVSINNYIRVEDYCGSWWNIMPEWIEHKTIILFI